MSFLQFAVIVDQLVVFNKGNYMPQVAARINESQEKWLKDYFKTKSAGAEFILPWAVDIFFRALSSVRSSFTIEELKTIIECYKGKKVLPDHARLSFLLATVLSSCDEINLNEKYKVSRRSLETKLRNLDDTEATVLMIWASAFWVSKNFTTSIDEYVRK